MNNVMMVSNFKVSAQTWLNGKEQETVKWQGAEADVEACVYSSVTYGGLKRDLGYARSVSRVSYHLLNFCCLLQLQASALKEVTILTALSHSQRPAPSLIWRCLRTSMLLSCNLKDAVVL